AVDKNKFIYTCGRAVANDYAVTQDAYQMNFYGGNSDAVLYKFYGGNDCLDLFEPNENIFSAKEIKPWLPADSTIFGINGTIANANDADWYSIAVDAAFPNLMVVLRDLFDDYNLNLYNESGILIYQSTAPDNISDTIAVNNLNSGTYYIEIPHAVDIFDSLTCYRLQFYKNNLPFTPIGIPTTAESNSNSLSFSLYPNPVLNNVSFFIPSTKQEKVTVIIYDLLNRIVYDEAVLVNEGGKNYAVSVNTFAVGAYTLVIKSADQMRVAKFVKE
ncbi:MAG: T9SS type A sorting domain-containing protein, partial [Chitinophagales bacterium]|nr:T9SS type A sorting domain-containing protein [Chitinophagales bacterium]